MLLGSRIIKGFLAFINNTEGTLATKALRGGFWVSLSSLGVNGIAFVRSIILARLLVPEVFGLMSICLLVIRGLEVFTQTGFGQALIQRKANFADARDTAFTLLVVRGFILCGLLFLISPLIAKFYQKETLDSAVKVIALSFVFSGFKNINTIAYQKELKFKYLSYLEQITTFINFGIVVALAYITRSIWALVLGQVIASAVNTLISYIIIPPRIKFKLDRNIARELLSYGKFITGVSIVLFIVSELDNALIGKILGLEALGYYVLAFSIANVVTSNIAKVLSGVMFPAYSKLQDDPLQLKSFYLIVIKLIALIVIPAAFGILSLSPEIIKVVYGERWLPALIPLQILIIFGSLRAFAAVNGYVFNGIGKPNYDFWTGLIRLLMLSILIFPSTIWFGIEGTAIAVTISMIFQLVTGNYFLGRLINVKIYEVIRLIVKPFISGLIMAIIITWLKSNISQNEVVKLVSSVGIGGLIYLLLNVKDILEIVKKINDIIFKRPS
jgi:lipopolysaccharide exporter